MQPQTTPVRDPERWRIAKARARFKSHLLTYGLVNSLLWVVWAVTGREPHNELPWPIWPNVFWGIGVVLQGVGLYGGWSKTSLAEREYERLTRKQ